MKALYRSDILYIVNCDVLDKYSPEIKEEYEELNRRTRRRVKKFRTVPQYFVRSGGEAYFVSDHGNVTILENSRGQRFSVKTQYIKKKL